MAVVAWLLDERVLGGVDAPGLLCDKTLRVRYRPQIGSHTSLLDNPLQ